MKASLTGKTALITGAAKRIGRAIAIALAGEGADIVVHYRDSKAEAEKLAEELQGLGVKSWTVRADLGKSAEYEVLIERAINAAGSLDILVNNASIFPADRLEDITFENLVTNMEVNAWAPFVLSRDFARLAGHGKIINLHDTRVKGFDWNHISYIMSKHVLAVFTKMMALKYAPEITVNAVAPGLILPPTGKDESYINNLVGTVPLKRHGNPEDIAKAVVFLAKSDFITGQVIYVDGGRHLKEYDDG